MRHLDSNGHSVFLLYYHLVLVVKYRRKVIDDAVSGRAKEIFLYDPIETVRRYIETQGEES